MEKLYGMKGMVNKGWRQWTAYHLEMFLNNNVVVEVNKKRVLLMDEVDGMAGNEDRGGVAELINLIKITKVMNLSLLFRYRLFDHPCLIRTKVLDQSGDLFWTGSGLGFA